MRLFFGRLERRWHPTIVRRRVLQFVALLILVICAWGHVSELFDHWDHSFKTGNDTEYNLVIMALAAGAVICCAHLLAAVTRPRRVSAGNIPLVLVRAVAISTIVPSIASSPPLPLRI